MSATVEIHQLIEKLLVDTAFHDQLMAEPDPDKRDDIMLAAGFSISITSEELEAELARLSSAALTLASFEAPVSGAMGVQATWVSRLATLSNNAKVCVAIWR